jgi:hypothetical protein
VFPEKALSLQNGQPTTMRRQILLALAPLLDEASFNAAAHVDYLVNRLKIFCSLSLTTVVRMAQSFALKKLMFPSSVVRPIFLIWPSS